MTPAHQPGSYFPDVGSETGRRAAVNTPEQDGDWYEIRVQGRLDDRWSAWLDGLDLSHAGGTTVLRGLVADQAALHGLLQKLRDIGLPLLSVARTERP
jgi:hypothetical protein